MADSLLDMGMGIEAVRSVALWVFPNPTRDGVVRIAMAGITEIMAYNAGGQRVPLRTSHDADGWRCELPEQPGVYHLLVSFGKMEQLLRVVRLVR